MTPGARAFKQASCRIVIAEGLPEDMRAGTREVVAVASEDQRKGHGSALMYQICAEADVDGIVLVLMPKPEGPGMTEDALEAWYQRFGFVTVQTEPVRLMARQPVIRAVRIVH